MHREHHVFKKPEDENIKIWRYIDFAKFVSMIDRKALFFARADQLGDKFEGSLSKKYLPPISPERESLLKTFPKELLEQRKRRNKEFRKALRRWTVINCWNMSECDSASMWKVYLKSDDGVAIQSTYKRLSDSFSNYQEDDVFIGVVNYIDYEKETIPWQNFFFPFVYKKRSFEHERELRAVILRFPKKDEPEGGETPTEDYFKTNVFLNGLEVPVDLTTLVEQVFVSPYAEKWFEDLVASVMKKYNFNKPPERSSLAEEPIF